MVVFRVITCSALLFFSRSAWGAPLAPVPGAGGSVDRRASCPHCNFNATVLEAFTQDFALVSIEGPLSNTRTTTVRHATGNQMEGNGTIALDVRHMQARLTFREVGSHDPFQTVDWDIWVNGVTQEAFLHMSGSGLDACMSATLPPIHVPTEQQVQVIEQAAPTMVQQGGHHGVSDGLDVVVLSQPGPPWETPDTHDGLAVDLDNQTGTLALLRFPRSHRIESASMPATSHTHTRYGLRLSNYRASTHFGEVGCTTAGRMAAKEILSNPEARAHFEGRLRQLERHALALHGIAPLAHVFAAVPTRLVDVFFPDSLARSDMDMLHEVHGSDSTHTLALSLLLLGLIVIGGGLMIRRALSPPGFNEDSYEDLTP